VKSISECVLNVLNDNINLTACQKKRLRKFNVPLRALADKRESISTKKRLINQRRGFLVSLLSAILPNVASLIFRSHETKVLRKMYLVSPDYLKKNERPSQLSTSLPKSTKQRKSSFRKTAHSTKHKTRARLTKKKKNRFTHMINVLRHVQKLKKPL